MMTTFLSSAPGATFVYVSKSPEQQIQVFRLNPDDGSLTPTATVDVEGTPGCLTVDAEKQYLFASLRSTTSLASFRIDPSLGDLTMLSRTQLAEGANSAFQRTDATGRWLPSASYLGARVAVFSVTDGVLGEAPRQTVETVKTAHNIAFDRSNTWVFVPHVAPNVVYQFRFDPVDGLLTDAGRAPGGAEGAGPRHLAWHPTLNTAFTSNESGSSITAYRFDPNTGLAPVQTLSTLPPNFTGKNTTAEVKVHPSGRFVWVSNRGHDSLAGFAIDDSGHLTALGQTPTEATPRSFDIDASGKYLFGAGEGSGKLAVFAVDPSNGSLERKHTYEVGKSLSWVLAVDLNAP
jgi:6-phosphogluconolactonase